MSLPRAFVLLVNRNQSLKETPGRDLPIVYVVPRKSIASVSHDNLS